MLGSSADGHHCSSPVSYRPTVVAMATLMPMGQARSRMKWLVNMVLRCSRCRYRLRWRFHDVWSCRGRGGVWEGGGGRCGAGHALRGRGRLY